ncbi:hypothetical protein Vi05172_g12369 [Venturia inaequalis]|nr:hypothetical protein Vi05172_g12369 [Venturia inaequalis]
MKPAWWTLTTKPSTLGKLAWFPEYRVVMYNALNDSYLLAILAFFPVFTGQKLTDQYNRGHNVHSSFGQPLLAAVRK